MRGDRPADVTAGLLSTFQLIVSCATNGVLRSAPVERSSAAPVYIITFPAGRGELRASTGIYLNLKHWHRVDRSADIRSGWIGHSTAYQYAIEDREQRELIAYHWHPVGQSHVTTPHIHIPRAGGVIPGATATVHFPSGRVSLEEIIRLVIALGARPLRRDWQRVLERTEADFARERTW